MQGKFVFKFKVAFCFLKLIFLFLSFLEHRDAEDAVHARDGYDFDGYRLRVEFPRGRERGPGGAFLSGRGASARLRGPPARRSQHRVIVSGNYTFSLVFSCFLLHFNKHGFS